MKGISIGDYSNERLIKVENPLERELLNIPLISLLIGIRMQYDTVKPGEELDRS